MVSQKLYRNTLKTKVWVYLTNGLGVIKADVIVSSVVVETDFDAVTADIIVESDVPVSIGVV